MNKKILIIALICCVSLKIMAQGSDCKVLVPDLTGKYTGECKNGLAHGKGTAEGKDKYVGNFKKGLPHKEGIYYYNTGEIFDGNWRNGMKNGVGKLSTKIKGKDTTIVGVWKDDKLQPKEDKTPKYEILNSVGVLNSSIRKTGEGNKVVIKFYYSGIAELGKFTFTANFYSTGTQEIVNNDIVCQAITFPLHVKYSYTVPEKFGYATQYDDFEFIIYQPGQWEVQIRH